jgi:hypothetical protein
MPANISLTELKGISEPLCKLIDAIRAGIGVVYQPTQIRRKAKAEADAAIIMAEGEAQANIRLAESHGKTLDIEARAKERIASRERRRQKNIEAIMEKAETALPETVSETAVDDDWVARFFEECQDIKNEEMQNVWAKLLAGEVARPGSFSLRTLALVKVLRKEDAHLFTRLCAYIWMFPNGPCAIINDDPQPGTASNELNFEQLTHLEALGLITFQPLSGFTLTFTTNPPRPMLTALYYGQLHLLKLPENSKCLQIGKLMLTAVGKELAPVAGSGPDEDYRRRIVTHWRQTGIEVDEPSLVSSATT